MQKTMFDNETMKPGSRIRYKDISLGILGGYQGTILEDRPTNPAHSSYQFVVVKWDCSDIKSTEWIGNLCLLEERKR